MSMLLLESREGRGPTGWVTYTGWVSKILSGFRVKLGREVTQRVGEVHELGAKVIVLAFAQA